MCIIIPFYSLYIFKVLYFMFYILKVFSDSETDIYTLNASMQIKI